MLGYMNKQEQDDGDQIIGRPHGPREDEEERDGLRVVSSEPMSEDEEDEIALQDEDILFDDDDRADLDIEPEEDRF
jgi:hypothetical protein